VEFLPGSGHAMAVPIQSIRSSVRPWRVMATRRRRGSDAAKAEDSAIPAREHAILRELIELAKFKIGAGWQRKPLIGPTMEASATDAQLTRDVSDLFARLGSLFAELRDEQRCSKRGAMPRLRSGRFHGNRTKKVALADV
jgi:hypothetical protein